MLAPSHPPRTRQRAAKRRLGASSVARYASWDVERRHVHTDSQPGFSRLASTIRLGGDQ